MNTTTEAANSRTIVQSDIVSRKQGAPLIGVSETTFWRLAECDDSFPPKIRLSARRVGWRKSALLQWLNSREGI